MSSGYLRTAMKLAVCGLVLFLMALAATAADFREQRLELVATKIAAQGVTDELTLAAMRRVERHKFVPEDLVEHAYKDRPLPIGYGQTISQPYIVAYMTEQLHLQPDFRVLEIGTGSGYQAAVLAEIVAEVYTIEIIEELAGQARRRLSEDYPNVTVIHGDGYFGWEKGAPYDAVLVTAAAEFIPPALTAQLGAGGRMIIPVGSPYGAQWLTLVEKERGGALTTARLLPVRFVPFTRR